MSDRLVITRSGSSYQFDYKDTKPKVRRKDGKPEQLDGEWLHLLAMRPVERPEVGQPMVLIMVKPDGNMFRRKTTPVVAIHGKR